MDKKVLKERLDELVRQIKLNSKDAHFANKLIEDLLTIKGQMMNEPMELDCGKKVDEYKGETFHITLTNKGVLYHEYGGYNIFTTPNNKALYDTLANIVEDKGLYATSTEEEKEKIDLAMSAIGYCISIPKIAFSDAEFTFEIAGKTIEYIRKQYDDLMSKELQEETPKEDEVFKNASLAMEELREVAKEELNK